MRLILLRVLGVLTVVVTLLLTTSAVSADADRREDRSD